MKKMLLVVLVLMFCLMPMAMADQVTDQSWIAQVNDTNDASMTLVQQMYPNVTDKAKLQKLVQEDSLRAYQAWVVRDTWNKLSSNDARAYMREMAAATVSLWDQYPGAKKADIVSNIMFTLAQGKAPNKDAATLSVDMQNKFKKFSETDRTLLLNGYTAATSLLWTDQIMGQMAASK